MIENLNVFNDDCKEIIKSIDWSLIDTCRLRLPDLVRFKNETINELRLKKEFPADLIRHVEIYNFIRKMKPKVCLDTGVQNGGTTESILGALYKNKYGSLISLDSGPESTDGSHVKTWDGIPGQHINKYLKSIWKLKLGKAKEILLDILSDIGEENLDFFFHDDDHSKENVEWQFNIIREFISVGGYASMHDYHKWKFDLAIDHDDRFETIYKQDFPRLRVWRKKYA